MPIPNYYYYYYQQQQEAAGGRLEAPNKLIKFF
jgi:hypothetical protein